MKNKTIDLRILTYIECEEKITIITKILNFLNSHNIITNLTMLYHSAMRSENMFEHQDSQSLTIDMRDHKFRFKFWDGSKIYWSYHLEDLFNSIIEGRKEYQLLTEKYAQITKILFDYRDQHYDVHRLTYKYYPSPTVDIKYEIEFVKYLENQPAKTDEILKDIYAHLSKLEGEYNFDIDYTFQKECIPCQKAKERQHEKSNE